MSKKLTVSHVKSKAKQFDETDKLYFYEKDENGNDEEFHVEYFPYFSNDKVQEMIIDLGKISSEAKTIGLEIPEHKQQDFLNFLVCKHFTNMSLPKDVKQFINFFNVFIKTDYYKEIMNSFPIESLTKVADRIYEIADASVKFEKSQQEMKRKYEEMNLNNRAEIDAIVASNTEQNPVS